MKKLFMLVIKGVLVVNLMMVATSASAAYAWLNDLTIKKVELFHDGAFKLRVYVNEPINTGCSADSLSVLTWQHTALYPHAQSMQSLLQQAAASGSKVNLLYSDNACYQDGGRSLQGVSVDVSNN